MDFLKLRKIVCAGAALALLCVNLAFAAGDPAPLLVQPQTKVLAKNGVVYIVLAHPEQSGGPGQGGGVGGGGGGNGGGGGSGTVSGQASGVIPLGTSPTVIGNQSHLDDGVTTAKTITSTEPFVAPSFSTPTTGVAGLYSWGQGTVPPLFSASVNVFAPTSVTAYGVQLSGTAPSVASYKTYSAPSNSVLTFNATPTAGGSAYVQGDVGSLLTLTCGATVAITQVNSGSGSGGVTAIATSVTTPGAACTTGTGKTTTGGTGTGATVNVTALAAITTESFTAIPATPFTMLANATQSNLTAGSSLWQASPGGSASTAAAIIPFGNSGTAAFSFCGAATVPGAGQTITFTLYQSSTFGNTSPTSTSATCLISGTNPAGVVSGTFTVTVGTFWEVRAQASAGATTSAGVSWGLELTNQ